LNFVKSAKVKGWAEVDPFWPMLACDRQDLVYASDENNHKVWIYDADLNYRGTIGSGPVPAPFQSPLGLAFAPTGELWVSDMGNNRLLKLSPFTVPVPAR
jgi:DNA-binding beta-propeller fold protein YncE